MKSLRSVSLRVNAPENERGRMPEQPEEAFATESPITSAPSSGPPSPSPLPRLTSQSTVKRSGLDLFTRPPTSRSSERHSPRRSIGMDRGAVAQERMHVQDQGSSEQEDGSGGSMDKGKARDHTIGRSKRRDRPTIIQRPNTAGLPHHSSPDLPSGLTSPSTDTYSQTQRIDQVSMTNPIGAAAEGRPFSGFGSAMPLLRSLSSSSFPHTVPRSMTDPSMDVQTRRSNHVAQPSVSSSLASSARNSPAPSPPFGSLSGEYGSMGPSKGHRGTKERHPSGTGLTSPFQHIPNRGNGHHSNAGYSEAGPSKLEFSRNPRPSATEQYADRFLDNDDSQPLLTSTPYDGSRSKPPRDESAPTTTTSIFRSIRKKVSSAGLSLHAGSRRRGGEYDDDVRSPGGRRIASIANGLNGYGDNAGQRTPRTAGPSRRESGISGMDGVNDGGTLTGRSTTSYGAGGAEEDRAWGGDGQEEAGREQGEGAMDVGVESSGVRVWYSSWTSIDWLHDQIKDSARVRRLRSSAKKSLRGWIRNALDRSTAWILVTIIGVLTACVAFLVIRLETALFDLKSGYCPSSLGATKHRCRNWITWQTHFDGKLDLSSGWLAFGTYFAIAAVFALLSSTLTVYLTVSMRFDTPEEDSKGLSDPARKSNGATNHWDNTDGKAKSAAVSRPVDAKPLMYFAAGSGIPEIKTILQGYIIKGYLGGWTLFVKSFGLALSVASGMSLGKEGPFVHIASAISNCVIRSFSKYETNEGKKREIYSAACAAGVSVAFGAPLGGTLFSWEEASTYYGPKVIWRSFFCAAVAALTLRALDPYYNGKLVLLELNFTRDHHSSSIYIIAVVLGIFGGVYGGIWNQLNLLWSKKVRNGTWLKRHPIVEVAVVIAVTTLLSFPSHYTRMGGVEWVAYLFEECVPGSTNRLCSSDSAGLTSAARDISWTFLVRAGLAVITFGIKLPAGIFVPSLAAGAAAGRLLGIWLDSFQKALPGLFAEESIVPGVYALLGAAAALAGVTRTTVSLVVIVAELTSSLDYVVPVALSVLVAKTVADSIEEDSIYELVIQASNYPYLDPKKEHRLTAIGPLDVMDRGVPHLRMDMPYTAGLLRAMLIDIADRGYPDGCFPCLRAFDEMHPDDGLEVLGLLAVNELQYALDRIPSDEAQCSFTLEKDTSHAREASLWTDSPAVTHENRYNLAKYIDLAPLTVHPRAPLELVQQFFVRLGARCIVVVDGRGAYQGMILKRGYARLVREME